MGIKDLFIDVLTGRKVKAAAEERGTGLIATPIVIGGAAIPKKVFVGAGKAIVKAAKFLTPKTPIGALKLTLGAPVIAGALTVPAVKTFAKKLVSPKAQFERGKAIGKIVEDPSKLLPKEKTVKEKVKEVAAQAGLGAAGAAAVVGGVAAIQKAIKKRTEKAPAASLAALPAQVPPSLIEPVGAVQPTPKEEEIPTAITPTAPAIKNVFKPSIDISFRKSKKFINQQILIRQ